MKGRWIAVAALGVALTLPAGAWAFCGFYVSGGTADLYNNATNVVMMREGTRTVLSMQNNYQGPPEDFAMVVPVPVVLSEEEVKTLPRDVFARVDAMAAPRLVEYWEQDPCNPREWEMWTRGSSRNERSEEGGAPGGGFGVVVEAEFSVGEYDIVILSASDAAGLDTWLRTNGYNIPEGAEPLLRPYIAAGSKFFVARVDVERVTFEGGQAMLSPLRFHYDSDAFALPIRLGLINAGAAQDLIVHILAPNQRYEVANYPNVTIPTNLAVTEEAREQFAAFYTSVFDKTLELNPGAVVTEYAWDASTCDPCPGPTLTQQDFLTLGADVLPSRPTWGLVLTRLHARYTAETLGDDLIFTAAAPIVGGREVRNSDGLLEHGSTPADYNNFQGRYIIRHPWEGEVACESPQRGLWGGPPGTGDNDGSASAVGNTAFVARDVELTEVVRQPIPELGISRSMLANPLPER
jgi:hypothetical protein